MLTSTKLLKHYARYRTLAFMLLWHVALSLQAQATPPGEKKVSISVQNGTVNDIFKSIRQQTGVLFTYSNEQFDQNRKVTLQFSNTKLDEVLKTILEDTGFTWQYKDNIVIIRKSAGEPVKKNDSSIGDPQSDSLVTVTGIVTDDDGKPLAGATVVVRGSMKGTTTDANGRFVLSDVSKKAVMMISSIGYLSQEIKAAGKAGTKAISLKEYVASLDETQVVAYGTTTQRLNTGNVTTIRAVDIEKQPVSNVLAAISGRVPGMIITQNTGMPGSTFTVQIRGQNSIANGNDPFYIVDGVPYASQLLVNRSPAGSSATGPAGNPLNFINPLDIESVSVLKDADATAIYGSRGANGVVLITTKKGKTGKPRADVNVSSGIGKAPLKMQWLNTRQYLEMRKEAFINDGITPDAMNAPDLFISDSARYTDWQKLLIGGTAHYTDAQASLSGGAANLQYLVGGGYHKESTVFPSFTGSNQKGSFHFNVVNTSADQKFKAIITGNYMADGNNLPATDLTSSIQFLPPNAPTLYNADGSLNWDFNKVNASNPLADTKNKYSSRTNNLVGNAILSYSLLQGLDLKSSFGYTNLQTDEISKNTIASQNPTYSPTGNAVFVNNNIRSWIIEPQATYQVNWKRNKMEALLGGTFQQNKTDGKTLFGLGYTSDVLLDNLQAAPTLIVSSVTNSVYKYNALFGRINYNFHDRYLLNVNFRRDGSSRFGKNSQFHNFGAIGVAWIFSEENLVKRGLSFLSFGKIRGSYGSTGSDQVGDYRFYDLFNTLSPGYQGSIGLRPAGLFNPNLAWEETKKLEAGLDLGFYHDRILLNVNYYYNRSSNQLVSYTLPEITGFSDIPFNLPATVQNNGWEFSLNTTNIQSKQFTWTTSVNLTIARNKLVSYPDFSSSPHRYTYIIGQPLSIRQLYRSAGVDPQTGVYQFTNSKGNLTVSPDFLTDRTALINIMPKYYGGFQNSFSFKGFQIDVFFQFVKQIGINPSFISFNSPGVSSVTNRPVAVLDRWQSASDQNNFTYQKFTQAFGSSAFTQYQLAQQSDLNYVDASFIRLKNLSLSYQLPAQFSQKAHLQQCSFYIRCQNLLTITNYKGMDPENQSLSALPPLRVITAGIQLTL